VTESFRKNKKGISLMVVSSICVCVEQLLWKISAKQGIVAMLLGFCFYGVGALVMSIVLAAIVLKEKVSLVKCIGVLIIIGGVIMIVGGDEE